MTNKIRCPNCNAKYEPHTVSRIYTKDAVDNCIYRVGFCKMCDDVIIKEKVEIND